MPSRTLTAVAFAAALITAPLAQAVPIVFIDADPGTAGVQSSFSVEAGGSFAVDILIEGVETSAPLNAFQFDLLWGPAVLEATGVSLGSFLPSPSASAPATINIADLSFAAAALGFPPTGSIGSGVLATVTFDALAVGTSLLDLSNIVLLAPGSVAIDAGAPRGASITVTAVTAVPEPPVLLLGATGLLLIARRARRGS